jgi:membrane fusion protein
MTQSKNVASPSRAGERVQLFRQEVLATRNIQWLGPVLLVPRRSHRLFTLSAVLALLGVVSLLAFGEFTRKARIDGWLVPHEGLVRVLAPKPGVVVGLYAREGAYVHKGERLVKLSSELQSATLGDTQAEVIRRLQERREALRNERRQQEQLLVQQQRSYENRLEALRSELDQVTRDIATMKARVELSARNFAMSRSLRKDGFISEQQLETVEAQKLELKSQLGALVRQQIALTRERAGLAGDLADLPVKARAQIAVLERELSAAEGELAQAEAQREIVVTAPEDGTVTAILVEQGGSAAGSAPLFSIVPAGSKLEAHLYSPSRAVGFVHQGQRVLLRYQAYPYQKFGHYEGIVESVSRSAVAPRELPPQLSGISAREPVYRITVRLARQTITAYGREIWLQPGMQLQADIALDTRRLYEWVLNPLYTMTGNWQG